VRRAPRAGTSAGRTDAEVAWTRGMKSMEPELEVGPERKGGVEPGSPRNQGQSSPAQTRLEVVHTSRLEDLGCCLCSVSGRATASVSHQHDGQDGAGNNRMDTRCSRSCVDRWPGEGYYRWAGHMLQDQREHAVPIRSRLAASQRWGKVSSAQGDGERARRCGARPNPSRARVIRVYELGRRL
jgi:hypothetical protein